MSPLENPKPARYDATVNRETSFSTGPTIGGKFVSKPVIGDAMPPTVELDHRNAVTGTCWLVEVVPGLVEVEVAVPPLETCLW